MLTRMVLISLSASFFILTRFVAYLKIGKTTESLQRALEKITDALQENSFIILGTYNPANKGTLKVTAFTRPTINPPSVI